MDKLKVLFLGARPREAHPFRLKEQVQVMLFRLFDLGQKERIDFQIEPAVTFADLTNLLLKHAPHIVHITGHSTKDGQLALEDNLGGIFLVPPQALIDLFSVEAMRRSIRLILLNTCYSDQSAAELSRFIDFVIGTQDAISQTAAIAFAEAFYPVLAHGEKLQDAFEVARAQFRVHLEKPDGPLPKLYVRPGANSQFSFLDSGTKPPPFKPKTPVPVFIHLKTAVKDDRPLIEELRVHLRPLETQSLITCWDAMNVKPGEYVDEAIKRNFEEARIILLLISADAVADKQWMSLADRAMARHDQQTAVVIPILLRPTYTEGMRFIRLAMFPGEGRAMTALRDRATAWTKILHAIRDVCSKLNLSEP